MFYEPIRAGTRGGQAEFKWTDVVQDKDRENYLGHSINAPAGRWQKNKDIHWYARDNNDNPDALADEIKMVKEAEQEALSVALGFKPNPNMQPLGSLKKEIAGGPSASEHNPQALAEKDERKRLRAEKRERKEERRLRREEKRTRRHERHERDNHDSQSYQPGHGRYSQSRSRSPPPPRGRYAVSRSPGRSPPPPPPPSYYRERPKDEGSAYRRYSRSRSPPRPSSGQSRLPRGGRTPPMYDVRLQRDSRRDESHDHRRSPSPRRDRY